VGPRPGLNTVGRRKVLASAGYGIPLAHSLYCPSYPDAGELPD